jgi:hypothetical protein
MAAVLCVVWIKSRSAALVQALTPERRRVAVKNIGARMTLL